MRLWNLKTCVACNTLHTIWEIDKFYGVKLYIFWKEAEKIESLQCDGNNNMELETCEMRWWNFLFFFSFLVRSQRKFNQVYYELTVYMIFSSFWRISASSFILFIMHSQINESLVFGLFLHSWFDYIDMIYWLHLLKSLYRVHYTTSNVRIYHA